MNQPLLSVVIITCNEEDNIEACIGSVPQPAEVIVLDSYSTDQTVALAKAAGARVCQRAFDNFAAQKNYALGLALGVWILSIDADEIISPQLRNQIRRVCSLKYQPYMAYRTERRLIFAGKRLRFGKTRDYPLRLVLNGHGYFRNSIHEKLVVSGPVGGLDGCLDHYSYKSLSDYFVRFNRYTSEVSENHWRQGRRAKIRAAFLLRPWFEFLNRYFFCLGFLDGYPGYCYALLSSLYAFVKYAKLVELSSCERASSDGQKDLASDIQPLV